MTFCNAMSGCSCIMLSSSSSIWTRVSLLGWVHCKAPKLPPMAFLMAASPIASLLKVSGANCTYKDRSMINSGATNLLAGETKISQNRKDWMPRCALVSHCDAAIHQQRWVDNNCLNARSALVQNTQLGLMCFLRVTFKLCVIESDIQAPKRLDVRKLASESS